MAGDQVWSWASPSEGELRPSEAHDFLSPSRPGPLLAIPKWLPLWKVVGALSHPGEELEGGHRPPEMLCRDGGHERQILGHLSLTAPVRIESFVFSRRLHSLPRTLGRQLSSSCSQVHWEQVCELYKRCQDGRASLASRSPLGDF